MAETDNVANVETFQFFANVVLLKPRHLLSL